MDKSQIIDACKAQLNTKIAALEQSVAQIRVARNNETKSSAGDKYETGRAMMQMEEDKVMAQLEQAQYQLKQLQHLPKTSGSTISIGSLVKTNSGLYFIAVSLGKVAVSGQTIFCISTKAPLAQQMVGKTAGALLQFNGRQDKILEVS